MQAHPEFPYITWDLKPQSKGTLSVAKNRGGPLDIAWEVHGEGENKMVVSVSFFLIVVCYLVPSRLFLLQRGGKDLASCSITNAQQRI